MRILDVYDDSNKQQLHLLDQYFSLPDFVKSAQVENERPDVPATTYADALNRRYPCHTKESTWLSQAYFLLNRGQYSTKDASAIQDRLTKFAYYWGLENIINDLTKKWEKLAESTPQLDDKDYALVVEHEGGKIRRMPLHNELAVKASADYLKRNRQNYPYEWRKTAALNLISENKALDADVNEFLEKTAGFGIMNPKKAAIAFRKRAALVFDKNVKDHLNKIAAELDSVLPTATLTGTIVNTLDYFDREYGLTTKYASVLDLPEDIIEFTEQKLAAAKDNYVQLTTGRTYPIEQLTALPLSKLASILGQDFTDAVTGSDGISYDADKFVQVVSTLPRNDAELLEKAINASKE